MTQLSSSYRIGYFVGGMDARNGKETASDLDSKDYVAGYKQAHDDVAAEKLRLTKKMARG